MVTFDPNSRQNSMGVDRVVLRLVVLGVFVVAAFVALFSRLWFLQVLAADEYRSLAKDNRVRKVQSEPARGRILDRNGVVLVDNRKSLSVTIDKQTLAESGQRRKVLGRLSDLLGIPRRDLRERLEAPTVSPFKPVPVANDVFEGKVSFIRENQEDFPGVAFDKVPVRKYPEGSVVAQILGWVNQVSAEELDSDFAAGANPAYAAGDIVGKAGVERSYDRQLRGRPRVERKIVNSTGRVIEEEVAQEEVPGKDLVLTIDLEVQRLVERALESGLNAARRARFEASTAGVVVMDPDNGEVLAMASLPTYDPTVLADGITKKEFKALGAATPDINEDDALLNRTIQGGFPPGSVYKVVTAGAALASGIADPSTVLSCPGAAVYPPEGGPGSVTFRNWTSIHFGNMGFPKSLQESCDTFYYELGWRMEQRFGPSGDGTEQFQRYARQAGFGHKTGIDLPNEADGRVPDVAWCKAAYQATKKDQFPTCALGWLPGFTVNMSIGQGDLVVTPLQMAVTYSAIANGGRVVKPHVGLALERDGLPVREIKPKVLRELPLGPEDLGVIRAGLKDVVSIGTARSAFAGFPLAEFPIAGKTGTAEIGETGKNFAWFVSYGPADDADFVIAVYVEKAGHGGESAAPIARQIWEGLFGLDNKTDVRLGQDASN